MGQTQGIDRNVALDARDLLACVITFVDRRVRILHALRVDDQKCAACVALQFLAGRANLIFFKACSSRRPPSRGSLHLAKYECTVLHFGKALGKGCGFVQAGRQGGVEGFYSSLEI